ncbi:uncharacterized protein CLIB1423_02S05710 [[Candida] railenensis]|uniref:Uncharacterized protein n=1 Tax=[Candida] railenensis TaxID=45579 RepID=A0A9P0QKH5_9ASCO|nr:uncharacterized protein CLIB1423_02S05710 [[Candida] railenensis]
MVKIFVSSSNVPIGYVVPRFPSIFWPLGAQSDEFHASYLYFARDMWRFTFYWTIVMFAGFYYFTGLLAGLIYLRNRVRNSKPSSISALMLVESVAIVFIYTSVGVTQGVIVGAIVGLLLSSVYKAGSLYMSSWIPFVWSIAGILFNVGSSYSLSSVVL